MEEEKEKKMLAVTSRLFAWKNRDVPLKDENDNGDEKKGKEGTYRVPNSQLFVTLFTSCIIVTILVWLTFVPFKKNINFVISVCGSTCIFSFASFYVTRSDASIHVCVLTSVSMVQLTYSRFAIEMPPWTEIAILGIVALVFFIENIVIYHLVKLEESKATEVSKTAGFSSEIYNDQAFATYYSAIITFLLMIGVVAPLPHVGIFNIRHVYLAILFLIWPCFTVSEEYKKNIIVDFVLPHSAIKGATLLYLHPYYWFLVVCMILFNYFMLKTHLASLKN